MAERSEAISSVGSPYDRSLRQWAPEVGSIVRQPLLDEFGRRHGYELVFKAPGPHHLWDVSGDTLTILDSVVLFGLERLTGNSAAFLACDPELISEDFAQLLTPSMTVLEIPSSIAGYPQVVAVCRNLRKAGFRFALLDFPETPEPFQVLELVQYVKMDAMTISVGGGAQIRRRLAGSGATLVATGIHSQACYRRARGEGFKYFQGYYFCSPEPVQNARIPASRLLHVEMLRELLKDPLELNTLSPLVKQDPSLVYRLLRQVNSAAYAVREPINSVETAVMMLGDTVFRRIAALAIGSALNAGRSSEILHTALVRARFCAACACLCNLDANDQYLLGLLSVLPGMLGVPMEFIAPELPLREKVIRALLGIPVHERCLLDWIECHEAGKTSRCRAIAVHEGLDESELMRAYIESLPYDAAEQTLVA